MSLNAKSFLIYKGDSVDQITNFISSEVGLNAYLIKDIQALSLNENITQLTILYNKYSDTIIDSLAPREGAIFTDSVASPDFDIRFLFTHPIDFRSIVDGTFSIDGVDIDSDDVYQDPDSNGYFVKLSAGGAQYQTAAFHTYQIGPSLKRLDGSSFPYTPVGGYVFHTLSSAHIGDYTTNYLARRRGVIKVGVIRLSKNLNPQQGIIEYLSQNQIPEDRLISYTAASRGINLSDVYFIYISKLEPQIVSGFPLNNSLLPDIAAPSKVTLVFSTKLDKSKLSSTIGLFSVEEGFGTSTSVSTNDISLLEDLKTVEIDVSSYFTSQKVYSILARPGILSLEGLSKDKPEQWTIHIAPYEATLTGLTGQTGAAPSDAAYVLAATNAFLPNAYSIAALNGLYVQTGGGKIIISGSGITQHYANTNNPHAVSAAQVGAPTTLEFNNTLVYTTGQLTGQLSGVTIGLSSHVVNLSNPHSVSAAQVGAPTTTQFNSALVYTTGQLTGELSGVSIGLTTHTTNLSNPHNVSIAQIGAASATDLTTHIADGANPHAVTAAQVGSPTIVAFNSALVYTTGQLTGQLSGVVIGFDTHQATSTIHFTQAAISITSSQISDFSASVSSIATGIVSGSSGNFQPLDASLTAYAALTTAADKYVYYTAPDVPFAATITTFGRSLVDDADAATAGATLGLNAIPYFQGTEGALVFFSGVVGEGGWELLPIGIAGQVLTVTLINGRLQPKWVTVDPP